jgi:hypothetical protein
MDIGQKKSRVPDANAGVCRLSAPVLLCGAVIQGAVCAAYILSKLLFIAPHQPDDVYISILNLLGVVTLLTLRSHAVMLQRLGRELRSREGSSGLTSSADPD